MNISVNIQAKADAILQERTAHPAGPTPIADEVHAKALQAILGGTGNWIEYMKLFKTNDAELARLIPTDGTTNATMQEARAYLVANGMCGMGTTENLPNNVTTKLD